MTYEHGKALADAPVTFKAFPDGSAALIDMADGKPFATVKEFRTDAFNRIARAFHLAKLAEEAKTNMGRFMVFEDSACNTCNSYADPLCVDCSSCEKCGHINACRGADWLARFDAAKGDA
jgi:hypothetical protein